MSRPFIYECAVFDLIDQHFSLELVLKSLVDQFALMLSTGAKYDLAAFGCLYGVLQITDT